MVTNLNLQLFFDVVTMEFGKLELKKKLKELYDVHTSNGRERWLDSVVAQEAMMIHNCILNIE